MKKLNTAFALILAALIGVLGLALPAQAQWRDPAARGTAAITGGTITGVTLSASSITDTGLTSGRIPYASTGGLLADDSLFTWDSTNHILQVGTGSSTSSGLIIGSASYVSGTTGYGYLWATNAAASSTNYALRSNGTFSILNGSTGAQLSVGNSVVLSATSTGAAVTGKVSATTTYGYTNIFSSATAPTISSGFGTTPSIAANNGTPAFTVNVGTGGTASSGVIGMPTATTGWNCSVTNRTAVAANRANQWTVQTATTTTSVTVQNQTISTGAALAWTASDVLALICFAY